MLPATVHVLKGMATEHTAPDEQSKNTYVYTGSCLTFEQTTPPTRSSSKNNQGDEEKLVTHSQVTTSANRKDVAVRRDRIWSATGVFVGSGKKHIVKRWDIVSNNNVRCLLQNMTYDNILRCVMIQRLPVDSTIITFEIR